MLSFWAWPQPSKFPLRLIEDHIDSLTRRLTTFFTTITDSLTRKLIACFTTITDSLKRKLKELSIAEDLPKRKLIEFTIPPLEDMLKRKLKELSIIEDSLTRKLKIIEDVLLQRLTTDMFAFEHYITSKK